MTLPQLEELEDRSAPSTADVAAFQQQALPGLQTQVNSFVTVVQSTLQTNLNQLEALAPSFPASLQPQLSSVFAQEQQFINAFPVLTNAFFQSIVADFEAQLLAIAVPTSTGFAPGFFYPFFPGFFYGYPGYLPYGYGGFAGYGGGYGGTAFTSGFSGGFSGGFSSAGSFGSGGPFIAGRGMGAGLMSTVGALTLPSNNHSTAGGGLF